MVLNRDSGHTLRNFWWMLCEFCPPAAENGALNNNNHDQKSVCACMEEARALWFSTFREFEKSMGFILLVTAEPHRRCFTPALLLVVGIHDAEAVERRHSLSHSTQTGASNISLLVAYLELIAFSWRKMSSRDPSSGESWPYRTLITNFPHRSHSHVSTL